MKLRAHSNRILPADAPKLNRHQYIENQICGHDGKNKTVPQSHRDKKYNLVPIVAFKEINPDNLVMIQIPVKV